MVPRRPDARPAEAHHGASRTAGSGSLSHRIELPGRDDEFRELADAFDAMLARLEAHVAEQRRFAANASHELRTPLATTQALLDVARQDPTTTPELVERLHAVNARAIDLTEALLLLSRADQRSFTRERVDLSLLAEDAAETLLPFAEKRGITLETSGDVTPAVGSRALLLQMTTNLVHNAIVHNLPAGGTVRVRTAAQKGSAVLTVENTGEPLEPVGSRRSPSRSSAAPRACTPTMRASASAWRSSRASSGPTTATSRSSLATAAACASSWPCPPRLGNAPVMFESRSRAGGLQGDGVVPCPIPSHPSDAASPDARSPSRWRRVGVLQCLELALHVGPRRDGGQLPLDVGIGCGREVLQRPAGEQLVGGGRARLHLRDPVACTVEAAPTSVMVLLSPDTASFAFTCASDAV